MKQPAFSRSSSESSRWPSCIASLLAAIESWVNTTDPETGQAFTDSAIKSRSDLGQYRILHFATHGFVTAPRP